MRARHRHINLKGFGAAQSYDARFASLADSAAVSTWQDRVAPGSGDATQATGALQPSFSLRGINGSSAIAFAGSDYLLMPVATSTDVDLFIVGNHASKSWTGNYSNELQVYIDQNHNEKYAFVFQTRPDLGPTKCGLGFIPPSGNGNLVDITASTNNIISGSRVRAGNTYAWVNGGGQVTVVGSQNWVARATQIIGAWYNSGSVARYLSGSIGMIALFQKNNSDSVRKRIEHAAAYSFKIACS